MNPVRNSVMQKLNKNNNGISNGVRLALFFTKGVSLKLWKEVGNFDREIKPYKKLLNYFNDVYFLTYGKNEPKVEKIEVLPVSAFRKELKNIDIFKTNQLSGSWNAVIAKKSTVFCI